MTYFYCWLAWPPVCPGRGPAHVRNCFRCWSWSHWRTRAGCWATGNGSPSCWSRSTPWSRGRNLENEPSLSNSLTVTNLIIPQITSFMIYSQSPLTCPGLAGGGAGLGLPRVWEPRVLALVGWSSCTDWFAWLVHKWWSVLLFGVNIVIDTDIEMSATGAEACNTVVVVVVRVYEDPGPGVPHLGVTAELAARHPNHSWKYNPSVQYNFFSV